MPKAEEIARSQTFVINNAFNLLGYHQATFADIQETMSLLSIHEQQDIERGLVLLSRYLTRRRKNMEQKGV